MHACVCSTNRLLLYVQWLLLITCTCVCVCVCVWMHHNRTFCASRVAKSRICSLCEWQRSTAVGSTVIPVTRAAQGLGSQYVIFAIYFIVSARPVSLDESVLLIACERQEVNRQPLPACIFGHSKWHPSNGLLNFDVSAIVTVGFVGRGDNTVSLWSRKVILVHGRGCVFLVDMMHVYLNLGSTFTGLCALGCGIMVMCRTVWRSSLAYHKTLPSVLCSQCNTQNILVGKRVVYTVLGVVIY